MTHPSAHVSSASPLVGRADALAEILALAADRAGVVVVAGEPGAGASRTAREAAGRLTLDGAIAVSAEEPGPGMERLETALRDSGHTADPAGLARIRPVVVLLGDRPGEPRLAGELARRLGGSRALVLITAREPSADAPSVILDRLSEEDATLLADLTTPGLEPGAARAIGLLGDGLPGRIVPLALAARRWRGGEAPLPVPGEMAAAVRERLAPLDAWPRDLAGWVAVVSEPVTVPGLARVCRESGARIEHGLEALVRAGVLEEIPAPPVTRWAYRDRVARAVVRGDLGGVELRRRHAAALVAGRAGGHEPAEMLIHALGSSDPPAVVAYGTRAAHRARSDGEAETALSHAARALAWWSEEMGESARLAALHEKGMALLDLSAWAEAAETLEAAASGRRELGERDPALASISAASSARWNLGQHDAALRMLQDHLARSRDPRPALVRRAGRGPDAGRRHGGHDLPLRRCDGPRRRGARGGERRGGRGDLDARADLHGDGRERPRQPGRAAAPLARPARG